METVFVTKRLGGKVLYDEEGLIGKFKNTNNDLVQGDDGIKRRDMKKENIWFMVLEDPNKVERAKKYPGFGISFNITQNKPVFNTLNNLKTFAGTTGFPSIDKEGLKSEVKKELASEIQEEKIKLAAASREYGKLYGELHKLGGALRKDADPVKVARLKELEEQLGIKEKAEVKEEEAVV